MENAGAEFYAKEVGELLDMDDVVGIAEIMDYVGVMHDSERMHTIIDEGLRRGMFLQGHAPYCSGRELAAYLIGGPVSDHESVNADEVRGKLRAGMHVNLRASSLIDNLSFLVDGCKDQPWRDFVSVCTDDVHAKDLLTVGHINNVVRKAVASGLDGREVVKMATLNAAREYGFNDLGAIAPGYIADIQLVDALDGSRPKAVFTEGVLVAEDGKYLGGDCKTADYDLPNTVNMPQIAGPESFVLRVPEGYTGDTIRVNVMVSEDGNRILSRWSCRCVTARSTSAAIRRSCSSAAPTATDAAARRSPSIATSGSSAAHSRPPSRTTATTSPSATTIRRTPSVPPRSCVHAAAVSA